MPDGPDAAEILRARLQVDLRAAMKAKAAPEVSTLRVLIAAMDNAGAVPIPPKHVVVGEVERRRLDAGAVQGILAREHEALAIAAAEYARLGRGRESEAASRQMAVVSRYLALLA